VIVSGVNIIDKANVTCKGIFQLSVFCFVNCAEYGIFVEKVQGTRNKVQGTRYKEQGTMYKEQGTSFEIEM
jgi:hypothetical protein